MAGKLTFGIEMEGGEQVVEQLSKIITLQKQISEGGLGLESPLNNAAMGAERLSAGLSKVISQMGELGDLGKVNLAAAKATIVSTIPPSVEQGKTSPSLPISIESKTPAPITLPDESKRLESALKRIMPDDKLAQSLISGKWTYAAPKPTKSADESASLQKWLEQGSKPFAGLDKIGRSLLGGNWTKEMPETKPPTPKEQSLDSWREKMAKMQPTITIA